MNTREIKFRAWDKEQKRFGYIDLSSSDFGDPSWFNEELMQYTGLKDKNGVEIYEGDILKVYTYFDEDNPSSNDFTVHQVEYMLEKWDYPAYDLTPPLDVEANGLSWAILSTDYEGVEVIGNIYENPELINPREE